MCRQPEGVYGVRFFKDRISFEKEKTAFFSVETYETLFSRMESGCTRRLV